MRRMLWSAGIAVILSAISFGQAQAQFPINISVGPTFANLTGDDVADDIESKTGFFIAAGTAIPLSETFSLGPNLVYVQKGATSAAGTDLSLNYIEIPILLNAGFGVGESSTLAFSLGPQVAFNVTCEQGSLDCSEDPDLNGTEFGIVAGANLQFPVSDGVALAVGGGGDFGLTDVFDGTEASTSTYYLLAGISFLVGD